MTGEEAKYRLRKQDLQFRVIEGEVLALDLRSSTYLAVNDSGAALWPLLEAGASRSELADALATRFAIPRERAEADLERFLAVLRDRDLLETS
jgi:hypothetical protein